MKNEKDCERAVVQLVTARNRASLMSVFFEHEDDPGFQVGQNLRYNGHSWLIVSISANSRGVWLHLEGN